MRNKIKGLILLIIGFYLFFGNTILSILIYTPRIPCIPTPDGGIYCVPLEQLNIFEMWLNTDGRYIIAIAVLGLVFIIIGSRYFVIKKELEKNEDMIV